MTSSFRGVSARKFAEKLHESLQGFSASFRGVSSQNLAEKNMVCASSREISRSFLRESSRLRIFVRGVNAKTEFFLGLICISSLHVVFVKYFGSE